PQGAKSISPKGQHPISPNGEMDVDETAKSLTETTSENTSETTTDSSARGAAAAGVDEGFSDRPNRESLVEPSTELEKLLAAEWNFTEFTQPMVEALNASMRDKENPTNKHPSANEMYRDTPLFRVWLTDEYL